jgi:glycosyltransferase involved in cell wall biosynthesis
VIELPLVSVVTPSLNQGRYIEDTVRSVLGQQYPRLEYLVVDGGSSDGTLGILERYHGALRWISEPDAGQGAAVNKGFRLTSGDIVGWVNSDDIYEPGAISAAVDYLRQHPDTAMVYGDATHIDAEGRELGPCSYVEPHDLQRLIHEVDYVVQPAAFFRRSVFEAVGGLDESLHWGMDYDLWLKIARRFPIAYMPRKLARYRQTGENKTTRGRFDRFAELERIGRRHGAGGLPAVFSVDYFWMAVKEARRLARSKELGPAARLAGKGFVTLVGSPRALRYFLRLCVARVRSRRAGMRPSPSRPA